MNRYAKIFLFGCSIQRMEITRIIERELEVYNRKGGKS